MKEEHPLKPFLPRGAKLLMLGSFPPKTEKWSMNFYYPNWQNDMWRIFGLVFFGDKNFFADESLKKYKETEIKRFLEEKGIAVADSAKEVFRKKGNASDAHLEVLENFDFLSALKSMPECLALAATGQKSLETVFKTIPPSDLKIGESAEFSAFGRSFRIFRMPSSSRAYPMALERKAQFYKVMFCAIGIL